MQLMRLEAKTWNRDSHELFDYEADACHRVKFVSNQSFFLSRLNSTVFCTPDNGTRVGGEALAKFIYNPQRDRWVVAYPSQDPGPSERIKRIYTVVKSLPNAMHTLRERDVIKLGRFRMRVKQLCMTGPFTVDNFQLEDDLQCFYPPEQPEELQCRICLTNGDDDPNDLLIAPCQCKGSIQYVHVSCLQHWYRAKAGNTVTDPAMNAGIFCVRPPTCELCSSALPFQCRIARRPKPVDGPLPDETDEANATRVLFAPCADPEHPFVVLDCLSNMQQLRAIHIVTFPESRRVVKLGRGHEANIRIPDVSISRVHAELTYDPATQSISVRDNNAKFGTLVQFRPAALERPSFSVQMGRTIVDIEVVASNPTISDELSAEFSTPVSLNEPTLVSRVLFDPTVAESDIQTTAAPREETAAAVAAVAAASSANAAAPDGASSSPDAAILPSRPQFQTEEGDEHRRGADWGNLNTAFRTENPTTAAVVAGSSAAVSTERMLFDNLTPRESPGSRGLLLQARAVRGTTGNESDHVNLNPVDALGELIEQNNESYPHNQQHNRESTNQRNDGEMEIDQTNPESQG